MDFDSKIKQKDVDILKAKLFTYGKLRSKREVLRFRLNEINDAMANHLDDPKKAAKELGIHSLDESHPAEQQMIIEKTTVEKELENVRTEMSYLDVDDWLSGLSDEDYRIVEMTCIIDIGYGETAINLGLSSKSTVKFRLDKIFKKSES